MQLRKWITGLALGVFGWLLLANIQPVSAAQEHIDFEVEKIKSNRQVNQENRFFDLGIEPGKRETIQVLIHNFSDKSIKVHSEIDNSLTQQGGGIIYRPTKDGIVRATSHTLMDVAKVHRADRLIALGPDEVKKVSVTIAMPDEQTKGMIYGAWHFIEYGQKEANNHSSISGNYAYNMGIVLRGKPYEIYPELKYQGVNPTVRNGHPALGIQLNNVKAMAIKDAKVKAVVYKEGFFKDKRVYETDSVDIAPNSQWIVPISWAFDRLKSGRYNIAISVKGNSYWNQLPMSWHFKKKITINQQQADKINQASVKKPVNKWAYVATASGILMLVSFGLVYRVLKLTRGL
ncbi:DUF3324 domain-containing protein [Lactobacillus curvatus]|nr:DUF3324 domain-containing protein [Latilactobacillus curvatus]MSE24044.1 DUF3324 domain-containing protein [Latilactobacillus curvatus]